MKQKIFNTIDNGHMKKILRDIRTLQGDLKRSLSVLHSDAEVKVLTIKRTHIYKSYIPQPEYNKNILHHQKYVEYM
jgi:hypothetical protein